MTLGGASAAFGQGQSHDAKCNQAASNTSGSNYNSNTASHGNFDNVPPGTFAKAQQAFQPLHSGRALVETDTSEAPADQEDRRGLRVGFYAFVAQRVAARAHRA